MTKKALVVLSGGQDSTVCLFWALREFDEVHTITFDYGQKHSIEINAAATVANMAGIPSERQHLVIVPGILAGRSPLTNPDVELEKYTDISQMDAIIQDRVELTFVPMRNALFLTLAANRAVCADIYDLVTGTCQADLANYPDCRQTFIWDTEKYISTALGMDRLGKRFTIHTPLMTMSKAETCKMALSLSHQILPREDDIKLYATCWDAMAFTHTSYDGKYPPTDNNHSNVLRAHGFEEANLPDPLVVRAYNEGLMDLPSTANYDKLRGDSNG